jgi:hypothetical protein
MRRQRRSMPRAMELTSLLDVVFIVMFAALIRAAAVQQAAAAAGAVPAQPQQAIEPLPPGALKTQALARLHDELAARDAVIARITAAGTLVALESGERRVVLEVPLLEYNPDPEIALGYLGDRFADLRICKLIGLHLAGIELARHLVIVAPDRPLADLPHALYEGLRRDVSRCLTEHRALAVVVEPVDIGGGP